MQYRPIEVVQTYFKSLQSGDFSTLQTLFSDSVVWHQPGNGKLSGLYNGKDAVFALFGKFMEISQGSFRIDQVKQIMENGDSVAATLTFSAAKDGEKISMDGVDLMKVTHGKIAEVWLFSGDQAAEDAFWS